MIKDEFHFEENPVFIDDLDFSEVSHEIENIITNLVDGIDMYSAFCRQQAKLIAQAIEPEDLFTGEYDIPVISVALNQNISSFCVEWQRNRPVLGWSGEVKSIQRSAIKLTEGRLRYPSAIFNSIEPILREKFVAAEQSLSKIRKQQTLLSEMRRLIRRLEYASKGVLPVHEELTSVEGAKNNEAVHV